MATTHEETTKIAIIGAGPGGLCLARLLQVSGTACRVYEADSERSARSQGGTLDLHPRAGQRALREAGLNEEFDRLARPEADCDKIVRFDGRILWDENQLVPDAEAAARPRRRAKRAQQVKPEIDRDDLRNILLDSLQPGTVMWAHKVARITRDTSDSACSSPSSSFSPLSAGAASRPAAQQGTTSAARGRRGGRPAHTLHFADGTREPGFQLVVGADGAWSKVRPLLTATKPAYAGITALELWSERVAETAPWLGQYVGRGSCYMWAEGRAVFAQRLSGDRLRVYACVRVPEPWAETCNIDFGGGEGARKALVQGYFGDCHGDIQRLVLDAGRDGQVLRKLHQLPVGHAWPHAPGLTCLGDAAHLMTPFGGAGVNLALTDALVLARCLAASASGVRVGGSSAGLLRARLARLLPRRRRSGQNNSGTGNEALAEEPGPGKATAGPPGQGHGPGQGQGQGPGLVADLDRAVKRYERVMFRLSKQRASRTARGLQTHFSATGGQKRASQYRRGYRLLTGRKVSEAQFNTGTGSGAVEAEGVA